MPDRPRQFVELERLLQQTGILEDSSERLIEELQDHYADLRAEACQRGYDEQCAGELALDTIGAPEDIAAVAAQYRELLCVTRRYRFIGDVAEGFLVVVSAPALPIQYCARRKDSIARWGASVGLAAMLTAVLLLSLQTALGVI